MFASTKAFELVCDLLVRRQPVEADHQSQLVTMDEELDEGEMNWNSEASIWSGVSGTTFEILWWVGGILLVILTNKLTKRRPADPPPPARTQDVGSQKKKK